MNTLPTRCPLCGGEVTVTRIYCQDCDTTIEGRFTGGPFSQLTQEQLSFVETFIRCEGKITRMEVELDFPIPPSATACMRSSAPWGTSQVAKNQSPG